MARPQKIIAVGASMGGVEALQSLVAAIPANFPAALLMVLHVGGHRSSLPELLDHAGALPAVHPRTGDVIEAGHIYVAPPDHHMTVESGRIQLTRGPRENWARPAIDPLFRSVARAYGTGAIGVILTGALDDGTAGLHELKRHGGTTVVQDPNDAVNPGMPRSALAHVAVDHCLKLAKLPELLVRLVAARAEIVAPDQPDLAGTRRPEMTAGYTHARPVAVTCPDCGGALERGELGGLTRFTCHIGHVYTAEVMVEAQAAALERSLETALRSLGEREELCRQMAETAHSVNDPTATGHWLAGGNEARKQAATLRNLLENQVGVA